MSAKLLLLLMLMQVPSLASAVSTADAIDVTIGLTTGDALHIYYRS